MNGKGKLKLEFLDVYGEHPDDRVDIFLRHTILPSAPVIRDRSTSQRLVVTELESTQGGVYSLQIFPVRHRVVSRFVRIREGQTTDETFVLPVDPARVTSATFPVYDDLGADLKQVFQSSAVEGNPGLQGAALFEGMDAMRKAGLLNIYAKMKRTVFSNGRDVFSYVTAFTRIRGDRFFASVQKELRDEVKNSISAQLFQEVSGALHTPPPGFRSADSFKTLDRYGNLQLTFFGKPETLEFIVDADIDEAQGVEHVFDVVHEAVTGEPTNPYNIHEILLEYQKIDPNYRLVT